ncbi:MAG: hypothetical protein ACKV19_14600 [Verrucomicrobiales bacterium]
MMALRTLALAATAIGLGALAACQTGDSGGLAPVADHGLVFFGPGRERLDFRVLPAVRFAAGSWEVNAGERETLNAAAEVPVQGNRLLVLGVGDPDVPAEHGRQQGTARALTVRRALVSMGVDPSAILVAGVSTNEASDITGQNADGPRAEFAVVR